ncbi:MAG: PAS domain S-box protein [Syntrophomonadaceae bacterium]|jgi:PAS domain S-box-containing protein|nr:PAS domain S-box protein [Syntrophomonadaceae bacterium]
MPGENTEHQSMLDSIENPVIALNQELKVSYCNPAYARQAGLNVDEIMGRYLLEVFPQKTGDDCHQAYLEVLETGKSSTVVGIIGNKYFNERIFRTPFGILSMAENIDHLKRWEVTVDSMVLNQRAVYDELNDAVIVHDVHDNQIIDVNQAACDIFGYAREEFLCLKMGELTADEPPYNKDDFLLWLKKPAELKVKRMEWKVKDKSGRTFWIELKSKRMQIGDDVRVVAVIQDITRRKYTEKELRELYERYEGLFENPADMIFIHDLAGNFISVNQAAERITGYWEDELVKMNIQQLASQESLKLLRGFQYQRMPQDQSSNYELEVISKFNTRVFLDVNISPIYKGGKASAVLGIARDVTQHKMREMETLETVDNLANFIDYLPDATLAIDLDGKVVVWNKAMEELTAIKAEDMLGKGNYEYGLAFYDKRRPIMVDLVLRPEEVQQYYSIMEVDKYTIISEFDTPYLRGEGHYLWGQAMPWYDKNGNLLGAIESLRDVTERYKSRQALREAEEKVRRDRKCLFTLIDNLEGSILSCNLRGKIRMVNLRFANLLGYGVEDLPGKYITEVMEDSSSGLLGDKLLDTLQNNGSKIYDVVLVDKEGKRQQAKIKIRPVWDDGKITGCIMRIEEAERLTTS